MKIWTYDWSYLSWIIVRTHFTRKPKKVNSFLSLWVYCIFYIVSYFSGICIKFNFFLSHIIKKKKSQKRVKRNLGQLQLQIRLLNQMSTLTYHRNCHPNLDSFALKVIVLNGWVPITKNSAFIFLRSLTSLKSSNRTILNSNFHFCSYSPSPHTIKTLLPLRFPFCRVHLNPRLPYLSPTTSASKRRRSQS